MWRRILVLGIFLLVLVVFPPTSVFPDQVRGVTDMEILVGQWGPQTGPAASWGAIARGTDLFFRIINEEGGIHGRKIKYFLRDDSYQPAKTKAIVKEFVDQIGVFAVIGGVGTATGMAVRDYLMESKVLWFSPASGAYHWVQPFQRYLFALYPFYDDEAYYLTRLLYERMGLKKVAMFYQNDDYGKQGLMGVERYLKEKGTPVVAEIPVEVTDRDLRTHALKLKNSGAQAVLLWVTPVHAALILSEAVKIGFRPQWATSNTLSDFPLMMEMTKGLWTGMINSFFSELPDSNHPLMVKYREWHKKLAPDERWGVFYYAGIGFAEPFVEGLRRTGRHLTAENLIRATETLRQAQGIGPPVTYSPTERQGAKYVFYGKVRPDGNIEKLTDWIKITK